MALVNNATLSALNTAIKQIFQKGLDSVKPEYTQIATKAGVNDWVLEPSGGGLLEHSGNLLKSINYNVGSNEVNVGSNKEYARRHQKGGGGIPARPYLGISNDDSNAIIKHIKRALRDAN